MDKYLKKIIEYLWPLFLTGGVATLLLGFVKVPIEIYYAILIISFFYSIANSKRTSYRWLFFIAILAFNCFISDTPPVFRVWERLFLLILILGIATPILSSPKLLNLRCKTLKYLLILFTILGSVSFFCYFAGINMMTQLRIWGEAHSLDDTGWFSGITPHSMILAPISVFASIYLIYLLINKKRSSKQRIRLILLLITVVTAILMAASRSALIAALAGIFIMLYSAFRKKIQKLLKVISILIIPIIVLSPLLAPQFEKIIDKNRANIESTGKFISSRAIVWDQRISEFKESPVFGIGFCTIEIMPGESLTSENGTIEPGSSWLAVLSMTGLVGMASILLILIPTLKRLYTLSINTDVQSALLLGLLTAIIIHMFAEGYIFSGGNPLCFFFWLLLGVSYQLSKESIANFDKNNNKKKNWPSVQR